jgi:hypothetical protein
LLKGRSSKDVLIALIKHYTDMELPKETVFGKARFLDPLPADKLDEDTFVPFTVPRGLDSRFLGQTGAMYRRYPLKELGTLKVLSPISYPVTTQQLIALLNQEQGMQLDYKEFVQVVYSTPVNSFTLTALPNSTLFTGSTAMDRKRVMFPVFLLQAFMPQTPMPAF